MSLAKLASFTEESRWWEPVPRYGRPPPRWPGLGWAALNPQPLPPHPEVAANLWQSLRLHRYATQLTAHKVAGDAPAALFRAAERLYEEGDCGNVPWEVLMHWLRDPPPVPPPWLELIGQAVGNAVVAARLGGDVGRQLGAAATSVVLDTVSGRVLPVS